MACVGTTSAGGPAGSVERDGVRLGGTWLEEPIRRVVQGAARRLAEPSCAAVLAHFRDPAGRALRDRLEALDLDAPAYARQVLFYDGSNDGPCRRPRVHAFTIPGSRVVRVCPSLGWLAASAPRLAESIVIHEVLHTLGLGENPPASDDITAAVERQCYDRVSPTGRCPGANAVIARPTTNTVTAPTTLYQRKATEVSRETAKTAAIPAKRP